MAATLPLPRPSAGAGQDPDPLRPLWLDAARQRTVPLRLRLPAGDGPAPLLLFSHGLGGNREGATVWGEAWAAAGYLVLHLQHPGSDTAALRDGSLRAAMAPRQLEHRLRDVAFVLDEVERRQRAGEAPWARADLSAVGLAGHSFGARVVQALAGERLHPALPLLAEPRIRAFIALSPSATGEPGQWRERFAAVRAPMFGITGTLDGDVVGTGITAANRLGFIESLPPGRACGLLLDGADHMSFAGQTGTDRLMRLLGRPREAVAEQREPAHHALVSLLSTRFWDAMLRQRPDALAALDAPAEVLAPDRWFRH